jgi:hypothetical protein
MRAGLSARRISRVELSFAIGFACSLLPMTALAQTPASVADSIQQMQTEIRGIQKHYEMEMRQLEQRHRAELLKLQRQLDELKAAKSAPRPAPAFPSPATAAPAALSYAPAALPPAPAVGQPQAAAGTPAHAASGIAAACLCGSQARRAYEYRDRADARRLSRRGDDLSLAQSDRRHRFPMEYDPLPQFPE